MLVDWDSFLVPLWFLVSILVHSHVKPSVVAVRYLLFAPIVSHVFRVEQTNVIKNQYWTHLKTLSKHLSASIWLLLLFNCGLVNVGCLNCLLFTELMNSQSTINGAQSRQLLNFANESSGSICLFFLLSSDKCKQLIDISKDMKIANLTLNHCHLAWQQCIETL